MSLNDSCNNFARLSGTLGGFSLTVLTLIISLKLIENRESLIVSLLLIALFLYIVGAGVFSNATKTTPASSFAYNLGVSFFHLANIAILSALYFIILHTKLTAPTIILRGMILIYIVIFIINIVPLFRSKRAKK